MKRIEELKFEAQKTMYMLVRSNRVAGNMVNGVIKIEKLKADDIFFNEFGFEEYDVEPNVFKLGLDKDPEYLAIVNEFSEASNKYLSERKDETAKMMALAQEAALKREEAKKKQVELAAQ